MKRIMLSLPQERGGWDLLECLAKRAAQYHLQLTFLWRLVGWLGGFGLMKGSWGVWILPPLDSNAVIPMDFPAPLFFHDGLLGWFVWLMLILNQCNLPKKGTLAFYLYSQYVSIHLVLIIHTDRIYIMYSIFEIRYDWDAHNMEAFLKTRSDLSFWLWHGCEVLLSLLHSTCVSLDGRNQCGRVGLSSEKRHRCFGISTKQNSDLDPGNKR